MQALGVEVRAHPVGHGDRAAVLLHARDAAERARRDARPDHEGAALRRDAEGDRLFEVPADEGRLGALPLGREGVQAREAPAHLDPDRLSQVGPEPRPGARDRRLHRSFEARELLRGLLPVARQFHGDPAASAARAW